MKKNSSVSKAFVFHHGIKLYNWPFLIQINTFGKWLRLSAKSLLSKTEKTQISEQTQIIWVRWSLCWPSLKIVTGKEDLKQVQNAQNKRVLSMTTKEINKSLMLQTTRNKRVLFKINLHAELQQLQSTWQPLTRHRPLLASCQSSTLWRLGSLLLPWIRFTSRA